MVFLIFLYRAKGAKGAKGEGYERCERYAPEDISLVESFDWVSSTNCIRILVQKSKESGT